MAWCSRKPVLKAAAEGESRDDPKRIYIDRATGGIAAGLRIDVRLVRPYGPSGCGTIRTMPD